MLLEIRLLLPTTGRGTLTMRHVETDVAERVPPTTWGRRKRRVLRPPRGRLAGLGHRVEAAPPAPWGPAALRDSHRAGFPRWRVPYTSMPSTSTHQHCARRTSHCTGEYSPECRHRGRWEVAAPLSRARCFCSWQKVRPEDAEGSVGAGRRGGSGLAPSRERGEGPSHS